MTLRPDLVLVALPPRDRTVRASGIVTLPDGTLMVDRLGLVLHRGAAVTEVAVYQRVVFGADVGEEVRIDDWPCLVLRVQDIDAVIEE